VIRLPTAAITALRNRLRERGARPSISTPMANATADELLDHMISEHYGPLCEAMYIMMAADGQITGAERDVIRGALRELDDRIRSRHVETMLAAAADALAKDGQDARIAAIGQTIGDDEARAEAAVLLAAAVAYADGEIADAEDAVILALLESLNVTHDRMRQLIGSLERVNTVLERDTQIDAADVIVHAASRLRTPEDFERLAATTDRPDVTLVLRLYASFVRTCDDLVDRANAASSVPAGSVAALRVLAEGLEEGRSERLDQVRGGLLSLVEALEKLGKATALRTIVTSDAIQSLERAMGRLTLFFSRSLERLGEPKVEENPQPDLRGAIDQVVRGTAGARDGLSVAIDQTLAWANVVPGVILATINAVLQQIPGLPIERPSAAQKIDLEEVPLPEWIPRTRTLAGWYIHRPLGDGGGGSVFVVSRAEERDEKDAPKYALKVPLYDAVAARSVSEAEYLRVFKLEAGALLALPDHPNIAEFVTFDARARPKPLLVMELVEGVDCLHLLKEKELDTARVTKILDGVLDGLLAMHDAGVGHLDVKPSNVVLRRGGEPVLVDFGLAGRHLRVGCATPYYASPEVWGHTEEGVSVFTADAYSFGCVAYELLTGKQLFEGSHVLALMASHFEHDGKPEGVQRLCDNPKTAAIGEWLASSLRRSPKDRATIEQLRASLAKLAPSIAEQPWPIV